MFLPGLAAAALVARDARPLRPVRLLVVSLATGLSAWFLGSELLARLDLLTTRGVVVATLLVGIAALVVAVVPGRRGLAALRNVPVLTELGVAVGAAFVAALPLIVLVVNRRDSLSGATPWYYLELARGVVGAHGFPAESAEWATRLPFLDDYPGFTAGTAVLLAVGGAKSMVAVQAIRLLTLLAVGAAAYLFARTVGAARSAAAVSVVVLLVGTTYASKLASYRPEATAYALVFLVAALAKLWMDDRRNVDLALATVSLLALSEVHGIGWLLGALIVGGIGVAGVVFAPERRRALRAAVLLAGALLGGWLLGNLALGGGLSGASKAGGLPAPESDSDPTWRFVELVAGRLDGGPSPSATDVARRGIDRAFIDLGARWYVAVVLIVVVLLGVIAWRGRSAVRRAVLEYATMAVLVVVACVAISVFFALRWTTYVPLRTGWGRLFPLTYALLPAAIALAITAVSSRRARLAVVAVVAVLAIGVMAHARSFYEQLDGQQPGRAALGGLRDLGLTRRDLVLTNAYSEGFVAAVLGARGVLDGRAPYSEPRALRRANRLLGESIRFFDDPLGHPLPAADAGTGYILVSTKPATLGTSLLFRTDVAALDQRTDLRRVRSGPGFILYKVQAPDA